MNKVKIPFNKALFVENHFTNLESEKKFLSLSIMLLSKSSKYTLNKWLLVEGTLKGSYVIMFKFIIKSIVI